MKKILLLLLITFSMSSYASTCNINLASNFDFKYEVKDNKLNIEIESKNKKDFIVYEYYHNINLFFNFVNKIEPVREEGRPKGIIIESELEDYFSDFSFATRAKTQNQIYSYPLTEYDKGKIFKKYTQTEDLKFLMNWLREYFPEDKKYGIQNVVFKIKLMADPEINKCIVFETKPIEVDFGNKYLIWINEKYDFYKDKLFPKEPPIKTQSYRKRIWED